MQIQRTIRKIKNRAGKTVYHARVRWRVDAREKWQEMLRRADNASNAQKVLDKLAAEIEERGPAQLQPCKVTFRELAQWSKDNYYVPAIYDDHGSKIAGVRGVKAAHHSVDNLVKFFGDTNIRKIDIEKLRAYKVARITGTCELSKVSLATVNRELSKARKLFNIALDKEWIFKTPFTGVASNELIQEAAETPCPYRKFHPTIKYLHLRTSLLASSVCEPGQFKSINSPQMRFWRRTGGRIHKSPQCRLGVRLKRQVGREQPRPLPCKGRRADAL
jgi:hypothetical protein